MDFRDTANCRVVLGRVFTLKVGEASMFSKFRNCLFSDVHLSNFYELQIIF